MHRNDLFPEDKLDENIALENSLHTISGSLAPKMLHLVGFIQNHRVVILIDSGNTHSFLDPFIFRRVSSSVIVPLQLQVWVANGAILLSQGKCKSVTLKVQGTTLTTYFFSPSLM